MSSNESDGEITNSYDKSRKKLGDAAKDSSRNKVSHVKGEYIENVDLRYVV